MTFTLNLSPKKILAATSAGVHLDVNLQANVQSDESSDVPPVAPDPQEESSRDALSTASALSLFRQQHPAARFDPGQPPIMYAFNRGVTTVTELQKEWFYGLYGGPSII